MVLADSSPAQLLAAADQTLYAEITAFTLAALPNAATLADPDQGCNHNDRPRRTRDETQRAES